MLPIMIIMLVTSLKDLFEDRKRYLSDKNVNNSSCRVYNKSAAKFESKSWKELQVGDIVHLSNDEMIPADILLLHTSDPNGYCYIDTLNLDGETNLKQREVPNGLALAKDGKFDPKELRAHLGMCSNNSYQEFHLFLLEILIGIYLNWTVQNVTLPRQRSTGSTGAWCSPGERGYRWGKIICCCENVLSRTRTTWRGWWSTPATRARRC